MAERSKAAHLRCVIFGCVGSNPTSSNRSIIDGIFTRFDSLVDQPGFYNFKIIILSKIIKCFLKKKKIFISFYEKNQVDIGIY